MGEGETKVVAIAGAPPDKSISYHHQHRRRRRHRHRRMSKLPKIEDWWNYYGRGSPKPSRYFELA